VILHFGDWHGEPPLVSQVYSERVLTSRVPLLLRGKLGRTAGIELSSSEFRKGSKAPMAEGPVLAKWTFGGWCCRLSPKIRTDGPCLEASTLTMDKQANIAPGW
jgi:hypothetical protein